MGIPNMRKSTSLKIGLALLLLSVLGCGGNRIQVTFLEQGSQLTAADDVQNSRYYDSWSFISTKSDRAVFKMLSGSVSSFMILKDSEGKTIATGSSSGYDDCGNFDGDASVQAPLVQGVTYTITATSESDFETGGYSMLWPDWVQLSGGGD